MQITVIGTGFVGVVSAAVYAKFGHQVYGLDLDEAKIKSLQQGVIPFFEPDLTDLVSKGVKSGRLKFTTSYKSAISSSDLIILAVGTPSAPDGQADLKYVFSASSSMAPFLKPGAIIAIKSTVPPGTNQKITDLIKQHTQVEFHTASLPEFLKEGSAVHDSLHPDRVVIGAYDRHVTEILLDLHHPFEGKKITITPESAQMSKYAANAYLAQRITFINQIANLCEKNGADVQQVIKAMGPDLRIGEHYWYPGLGYGGSCFPKDVKELAAYSKAVGEGNGLFVKIDELNEERIPQLFDHFSGQIGGWQGKTVAILGLSFKPNTDDTREAPSLKVIPYLTSHHATVVGYDPKAAPAVKKLLHLNNFAIAPDPYQAARHADVVILLIEWSELLNLDLQKLKSQMSGNIFIDTRNQYDPERVKSAGLEYIGVGR